jgi:hypothetical protein
MDHRDNARAEELNNLRLALATFALQLDAFEMRMSDGLVGDQRQARNAVPRPERRCGPRAGS